MDKALLMNINKPNSERVLNLKAAIAEGIENNLGYQIEAKQTQISAKDVSFGKSNYLPQLGLESTVFSWMRTVNSSFGTLGTFNWTAGASFSQLILSEPLWLILPFKNFYSKANKKPKSNQNWMLFWRLRNAILIIYRYWLLPICITIMSRQSIII
ncbi:MAG: TolC family protein [Saprospirales bacterium]|nr:TolC family protein [Saprospirales bacterium]